MSENDLFSIGAKDVNVAAVVADIQARVEKKMADGVYADARIARAERSNLANLKGDENFLGFYLKCLRDAVFIDINDFEIRERRRGLAPFLVFFKKTVWNLLKFYTYRLWSQQNQVNGLMVTAIQGLDEKYAGRIKALEDRIAKLEETTGHKA